MNAPNAACIQLSRFSVRRVKDSHHRCFRLTKTDARLAETLGGNMLGMILIVLLILVLIGAIPTWPHSRSWGYYPSGGVGFVLVVVVILLLAGVI